MKVLLMVQGAGDKRPKCVGRGSHLRQMGNDAEFRSLVRWRRWWLVECDNAEAGRACIAGHKAFTADTTGNLVYVKTRILATGGAREGGAE